MAKSALSVWKTARESLADNLPEFVSDPESPRWADLITLPEPPEGVSEPFWANLAFDPHCHVRNLDGSCYRAALTKRLVLLCKQCQTDRLDLEMPHLFELFEKVAFVCVSCFTAE
jgi:hypothetical protein